MIINIHETISNVYDEKKNLISSSTSESYIVYPEENKLLRNKLNGLTTDAYIGISSKDELGKYEEIDKE